MNIIQSLKETIDREKQQISLEKDVVNIKNEKIECQTKEKNYYRSAAYCMKDADVRPSVWTEYLRQEGILTVCVNDLVKQKDAVLRRIEERETKIFAYEDAVKKMEKYEGPEINS